MNEANRRSFPTLETESTPTNIYQDFEAKEMTRRKLLQRLGIVVILGGAEAADQALNRGAVTKGFISILRYLISNENRVRQAQIIEPASTTQAVQLEPVDLASAEPGGKPYKYYTGEITVSMSKDLKFRKRPVTIAQVDNTEPDKEKIISFNGSEIYNDNNVQADEVRIKGALIVRGNNGKDDWIFLPKVQVAERDEQGGRQIRERSLFVFLGDETQKDGLVKFEGGSYAGLTQTQRQTFVGKDGQALSEITPIYPNAPR